MFYVNDLDEDLTCVISKFADDTKFASIVRSNEQVLELQDNLDRLSNWAQRWQMSFNEEKCKVLHIRYQNEKATYTMNGTQLKSIEREKDLGVTISNDLKPSQ